MFELNVSWWELIVRSTLLSVFILILIRASNRGGGETSPSDQVIIITLGNIAASAAIKSDDSVSAAMISMTTFVAISFIFNFAGYRSKILNKIVEGTPKILIHNGKINDRTMLEEQLSQQDVMKAIREAGCLSIANVHVAMIETNGRISVIEQKKNN
jgi:uncharacterized membrane protein YcaP (DUF421 family)